MLSGVSMLSAAAAAAAREERAKIAEARALDRAKVIASLCTERRAIGVRLLDLRGLCAYADFLVVATAASRPQMRAIVRDVEKLFKEQKYRPINRGAPCGEQWTLLDYGDIVLHLFAGAARDFYAVEDIWADAPELEFPRAQEYDLS